MTNDPTSADLAWMDPAHVPPAHEALARIKAICGLFPGLDAAMLAVVATHPGVPHEVMAVAIKRFRSDTDALSHKDVVNLLVALVNGGRQGFDAVRRTRKTSGAKTPASLSWVKE